MRIDRGAVAAVLAIGAVFASQFVWVRATNFGGWDEWLVIDLTSRGVLGLPYENRPLSLAGSFVGSLLSPHALWGFWLVHGLYLAGAGVLVFLLVRRLAPDQERLALLAGILGPIWAPLDRVRLDTVLLANYSAVTLATLGVLLLLVESLRRRSIVLGVMAAVVGPLVLRTLESAAALLLAGPLILLLVPVADRKRWLGWTLLFMVPTGAALAFAAWPVLHPAPEGSYQIGALGFDPQPVHVAARILRQFRFHLQPLLAPVWRDLLGTGPVVSVVVFAAVWCLVGLRTRPPAREGQVRACARLGLVGLAAAALGYSVLALSPAIDTPERTQVLSAPGIGLFLAAAIIAIAARIPRRPEIAVALLGAWVVGMGAARTLALQREWDELGYWPSQRRSLTQVLRQAPDFVPGTFVVLLDATATWPATFGFRHALFYLYRGRAVGAPWGAEPFIYPSTFTPAGLLSTPMASIREPWRQPVRLYRYEEIVVMRETPLGEVSVLDTWPTPELPALPPGSVYVPRSRIKDGPLRAELRILAP